MNIQNHILMKYLKYFWQNKTQKKKLSQTLSKKKVTTTIPHLKSESQRFINNLAKIIKNKINVNTVPVYKSFKISRYFQLKSNTPLTVYSNAVYKFTCSCDINITYYGMSTRHLITRVREYLDFNSIQRSVNKDHILSCDICLDVSIGLKQWFPTGGSRPPTGSQSILKGVAKLLLMQQQKCI